MQWSRSFVWLIDFQCVLCSSISSAAVSSGEEVLSVAEAQSSTLSHAATRYQTHWSTKLYKRHAVNNVCESENSCVCFCGLPAPGLINILVSHEDIGALQAEKDLMRSDRARLRLVPVCNTPPLSSRLFTCRNKRRAAHDEHNAWKPRPGFDLRSGDELYVWVTTTEGLWWCSKNNRRVCVVKYTDSGFMDQIYFSSDESFDESSRKILSNYLHPSIPDLLKQLSNNSLTEHLS